MASTDFFGGSVVTAEELEAMTPAERRASFEESVITDLAEVLAAFLNRVKAEMAPVIVERDREQAVPRQQPQ